jgi:hypothetical protein
VETPRKRRSDRISVELPIIIRGTDALGEDFVESARTIVIARYGAKILCLHKLTPQLEISIHCLMTGLDSDARIVGLVRAAPEGIYYGIELLNQEVDLWGVEFPPVEESETAIGRALLECTRCRRRELVYLNEFEAEVLERSRSFWRHCKRCADINLWKETWLRADEELPQEVEAAAPVVLPPPPKRTRNDRKHTRLDIQMEACIRDPQGLEEVVVTENVSCGGLRFKSKKRYAEGWMVEVALPYTRGGANIFSTARVKYAQAVPGKDERVYGVAYAPWQDPWGHR